MGATDEWGAPLFNVGAIMWVLRDGLVLLVDDGSGVTVPPGGILEGDETPEQAGRRELLEETGLRADGDLRLINVHRVRRRAQQLINVAYLCHSASGEVVLSDEHKHFQWMDPAEYRDLVAAFAPTITDPGFRGIAEALLRDLDVICASPAPVGG